MSDEAMVRKILCRYKEGPPLKHALREGEDVLLVREIDRLTRELAEAREALDEIAFPISAMRKRAEAEGSKLDGMMANYLAKDPEYLRGIAVSALKEKP